MPTAPLFIPHKKGVIQQEVLANNQAIERHINDAVVSCQVIASTPTTINADLGFTQIGFDSIAWDYGTIASLPPDLIMPATGLIQVNAIVELDQTNIVGGQINGIAVNVSYGVPMYKVEPSNTITNWSFSRQFFVRAGEALQVFALQSFGTGTYTAQLLNLDMFYLGPAPRFR